MKRLLLLLLLFSTIAGNVFSQVVGDYRSVGSGLWGTAGTWQSWNGTAWVAAGAAPGATNNVKILSGHTITVDASGKPCADLVVDAGGKLYCNGFVNVYVNVYGDTLMCNGTIGNGATFDGISFNIYGATCRILGSGGTFDASRIRKNDATNTITNLSIERDVKLRFCGGRQTQIYNNANSAAGSTGTRFNVTVASGATLTLDSTVSADCQATGTAATIALVSSTTAGSVTVNTTSTTGITAGMMVSGSGIIPGTTVASIVTGTQFTLSQNAVITNASNSLTFGGNQITNTSAINSYYGAVFGVPGSLANCRVYGNGIAPGAYIVSATLVSGSTYNLQLSLPNTGPVSGTVYFVSDGNAAVDGITGTAPGASAGSFTVNGNMLVSGFLYLTTNNGSTVADSMVTWTINNGGVLKVGNVLTSASGAAKHVFRVMPGAKFEVFGLPGFSTALVATNNTFDFQVGSFTEFSGKGNQNVPVVLPSPSSGFYGNLKISGYGIKSEISTTTFQIANDFEITNISGAAIFNGAIASNLFVGGNWLNYHDSAFIEASIVTFNRTGAATIYCPTGEVFSTLKYQKTDSSEVKFLSDVTAKLQLSIAANGRVNLNGNTLKILSPLNNGITIVTPTTARYILGETGNFNSKVKWNIGTTTAYTRFAIPFAKGSGTANATPFAFAVDANVQVDTMTVSTYGTPATNLPWPTAAPYGVTNLNSSTNLSPDNRDAATDRFWYVGFTSPNVVNDTIVLTYASPSELPTVVPFNNPDSIRGQYWDGPSGSWALPVVGYNVLNAVVIPNPSLNRVWSLVSNISPMGPLPLPIELVDFKGKYVNNQSVLSWVTASEKDNDYFVLERSEDGQSFREIGKVDGAGNSSSFLNYQYVDSKPINQVAYYRLKQVDFDGHSTNSQIIALRNSQKLSAEIKAYPNPSDGRFLITNLPFDEGDNFVSQVYNLQGELLKKDLYINEANGNLLLQLNDLNSGVYWIRLTNGYTTATTRVILNK
ncbi:MAG: T9SS type A sorting domain-containing protein [Bacteroidota bacterium]